MRASTSGHANLIRDEGNTDPRHDVERLGKPNYKTPSARAKAKPGRARNRPHPTSPRGQLAPPPKCATSQGPGQLEYELQKLGDVRVQNHRGRSLTRSVPPRRCRGAYELCGREALSLEISFFPCIFHVAIGNSESQIEKKQVEKCKVLPLQEQQEETPQGKMRFKSAKNTSM